MSDEQLRLASGALHASSADDPAAALADLVLEFLKREGGELVDRRDHAFIIDAGDVRLMVGVSRCE